MIDYGPGGDPGCTSATDNSEATDSNTQCSDEIDNDSDGVSIRGMLPSGFLESLAAKRQAAR